MSVFFARYIPSTGGPVVKIHNHRSNIIAVVYPNDANLFAKFQDAIGEEGHELYLVNSDGTQTCLVLPGGGRIVPAT